jgi:UDPglucose 6-dehydrogenase
VAGRRLGVDTTLLESVIAINDAQRRIAVDKLRAALGTLQDSVIAILGLSFKPGTDDLRESPALEIARNLLLEGAQVRVYDPAAMVAGGREEPALRFGHTPYAVASGADAVLIATEWNEFRHLDLERLRRVMRRPILVDGRNLFEPWTMVRLGFEYCGIGRGGGRNAMQLVVTEPAQPDRSTLMGVGGMSDTGLDQAHSVLSGN